MIDLSLTNESLSDFNDYKALYNLSITEPERFWAQQAEDFVTWYRPWSSVLTGSLAEHNTRWFADAKLNVCYNCIDRHLPQHANRTALLWEGNQPGQSKKITYQALADAVGRFSNLLKSLEVHKGDRVCIYMPMIVEAAYAMLACARIGAVHSVVFAGFSPAALKARIIDADCQIVITADLLYRGTKVVDLKDNVDKALNDCPNVRHVICIKRDASSPALNVPRDIDYYGVIGEHSTECEPEIMDANDPLFILYTSGSTGTPKGVLHSSGGYLVYTSTTFKTIFNYREDDVYWCAADVGWVTGHSYIVYGPLANAAISVMFEGVPNYPDPSRFWQVVDAHQVSIFYTAPTAIRALMRMGDEFVTNTRRHSLRILGTVGEPINPDVWQWYFDVVGNGRCPVVDTWWQTETGGIMISAIPGVTPLKPGSATQPFFGIKPALMDEQAKEIEGEGSGNLVMTQPWPGMMQTVYGDPERFVSTYFSDYPGYYFTGDGAYRDNDDNYWIRGRVDDVINVAGHRLGTAEIESAIVEHPQIAEAAVVGVNDEIKGTAVYAFVTPIVGVIHSDELQKEVIQQVRQSIGPIATPQHIQWTEELPKTRSGKIMRRILRKIVNGDEDYGDISTLANPECVTVLRAQVKRSSD